MPLQAQYKLYIYVNDEEDYFFMQLNEQLLSFNHKVPIHKEIIDKQVVMFTIDASYHDGVEKPFDYTKEEKSVVPQSTLTQDKKKETNTQSFLEWFTPKLKEQLQKVQQGDMLALLMLLLISFGYGIVHALGPGHGKALAFSYFSSHKSSFSKAFFISLGSALIHILGALILVLVSLLILESFFNRFVQDSVTLLTQISAGMIMLLAVYLLFNKLSNKKCACHSCQSNSIKWSTSKPTPLKTKPKFVKKDLYFVLTAGLIPCPGTVVLFIYAFVLKTYLAVFLAAIFIALGMAVVIVGASFLGVGVRKLGEKSHQFIRILEIVSPMVMFILGVLLLLSAMG